MSIVKVAAFHNHAQLTDELKKIEQASRGLVKITSIGKSREGRDIWCAETANRKNEIPLQYRPALLMTGNMHATEIAGSCQGLHFLSYLVERYPEDEAVRRLLDEQLIYVIPRIAVDAADYVLATSRLVRSRHIDMREPNVSYPQDLNGDGKIMQMRWISATGDYRLSKKDPRILLPRRPEDKEGIFYELANEGLIHDWDGGKTLATRAECDFCRNFPTALWRPSVYDADLGFSRNGAYPLSEPEIHAMADFVLAHPNIAAAIDFHTGNQAIFYPEKAIKSGARYPVDAEVIERIGKRAEAITGWPLCTSYSELKTAVKQSETPGSSKDWIYERTGAPAYVIELGMFYNYLGFTTEDYFKLGEDHLEKTSLALLAAYDADPETGLFDNWQSFDHPQLGKVEIGGWNYVPWGNPPLKKEMENACAKGTRVLMDLAKWHPRVEIAALTASCLGDDLFHLKLQLVNAGNLPTCLTEQGREAFEKAEPTVELTGQITCVSGKMKQRIAHLAANGGNALLEWVVRAEPGTALMVTARSPRGVFVCRQIELKGKGMTS